MEALKKPNVLESLLPRIESELEGLAHGVVRIELHIRDGRLSRAVIGREESIVIQEEKR
jgi:hypothetical protein